jgi:hypothetical protein
MHANLSTYTLTEPRLFIFDGHVAAGGALVLFANEVGDLLVLGLLDGGLSGSALLQATGAFVRLRQFALALES